MGEDWRHGLTLPLPFRPVRIEQAFANGGAQHAPHDFRFRIIVLIVEQNPFEARRLGEHMPADEHVARNDRLAIGQGGNDFQRIPPGHESDFEAVQGPAMKGGFDRDKGGRHFDLRNWNRPAPRSTLHV